MPKRSAASIQNRLLEKADHDKGSTNALCPICGHPNAQHTKMRNSSFCEGCRKICAASQSSHSGQG